MLLRKSLLATILLVLATAPTVATTLRGWEVERFALRVIPSSPAGAGPFDKLGAGSIEGYGSDFPSITRSALSIPKAHAVNPAAVSSALSGSSGIESAAMKFFTKFLEVFVVLNWVALSGVEALLDPDFIFGTPDSAGVRPMEKVLHGLWLLSRNIVNAIFAFILLAGGVYLILNAGGEGMTKIKQMAPKFVLAVILVNFSWFFPRVIIDASHVMSAVIYQLPQLANTGHVCIAGPGEDKVIDTKPGDTTVSKKDDECQFVWRVVLFPPSDEECKDITVDTVNKIKKGCPRPVKGDKKSGARIASLLDIHYKPWIDVAKLGRYTDPLAIHVDNSTSPPTETVNPKTIPVSGAAIVINGLAVNFAKIPQMGIIDFKEKVSSLNTTNASILQQTQKFLEFFVNIVLHVILSIAVGLALLAFMAVLIVRVGVLWLCIAFMPFIFIGTALGKGLGDLGKEGAPNIWQKFLSYVFYPVLVAIPFSVGFTLASQLYYVKTVVLPTEMQKIISLSGVSDLHQFIWMIITICIIWFGVFAILEKDDFAKGIVGGIKGIGTTGLNIAKNAALYMPGLPLPAGMKTPGEIRDKFMGAEHAMRNWRAGQRSREEGGPVAPPSPPPERTISTVASRMDPQQFNELKAILGNTTKASATEQLRRFVEQVNSGKTKNLLSENDIKGIAMSENALRTLGQGKFTENELKAAEHFRGTLEVKGGATVTTKIGVDTKKFNDKDSARKEFATKALAALENSTLQPKNIMEDLATLKNANLPIAGGRQAIGELEQKLKETMTPDDMKKVLREIINPPPPPSTASVTPPPLLPEQGGMMLAQADLGGLSAAEEGQGVEGAEGRRKREGHWQGPGGPPTTLNA